MARAVNRTITVLAYGALLVSVLLVFFVTTMRPESVVSIAGTDAAIAQAQ